MVVGPMVKRRIRDLHREFRCRSCKCQGNRILKYLRWVSIHLEQISISSQVEPKWKMEEQFIFSLHRVFLMDSLKSTHPISARVSRPEEINELFDRISYVKGRIFTIFFLILVTKWYFCIYFLYLGASVIRMMDHFLTRQVFRKGLTKYLKSK